MSMSSAKKPGKSTSRKSATASSGTTSLPMSSARMSDGEKSCPLPVGIASKLMILAATMISTMATSAVDLCLGDQDGVWEVACAPHSWLSEACDRQGLRACRINLEQGYDLYKAETWHRLGELRRQRHPRKIWFSLPCTKFCRWTYVNYNTPERQVILEQARRKERRMLWNMNKFIKQTILEDPNTQIYFEWTHPCQGWSESPMRDLEQFFAEQEIPWLPCRIDGCVYGMKDQHNENFVHKKWMVKTTDESFHACYKCKVCHGGHSHTLIQGVETSRSAYYPWKLVESIARFWRRGITSDRQLRMLFMKHDVPLGWPEEEDMDAMAQEIADDSAADLPLDELQPTPEERQRWTARVAQFHRAAGHPTNRNLAKIIKDSGQPRWKQEVALQHQCPACQSLRPGGTSAGTIPPAATHQSFKAWQAIGLDTAEWHVPGKKTKIKFIFLMDVATKLRMVHYVMEYDNMTMRAENAEHVMAAINQWLAYFPKPQLVIADNGKSYTSERLNDFLRQLNIQVHYPPEKEPWAHGIIEAGIQDLKHTASALQLEDLEQDPKMTLVLAASSLNSTEYTAGFSAHQWAFGRHYALTDEDYMTYEQLDPQTDFSNLVNARQKAEEVALRTRAKRVLSKLANTTSRQPLRSFDPMQLVKIWRRFQPQDQHKGSRGGFKKSGRPNWVGPGRVVFQEVLPHQESGDERRHILWVLIGNRIYRCSPHSVRPVTEVERLQHEMTTEEDPTRWKSLADILPRREFTDLLDEVPGESEVDFPQLPDEPDATTRIPARRATSKKTLNPSDWRTLHRSSPLGLHEPGDPSVRHFVPGGGASSSSRPADVLADLESDVNDYSGPEYSPELPEPVAEPKKKSARTAYNLNWVQELEKPEPETLDLFAQIQGMPDLDVLVIEIEVEPESNTKKKFLQRSPVAYLVKKMSSSEVNLQKLNEIEKVLFCRAKMKEVQSFLKNQAVRKCLDDEEIREAYGTNRILKARWVLTWKPIPPDEREEALLDARENPQTVVNPMATKKAKARIVLLGFQHPSLLERNFKTAAPVQSNLGRNLLYVLSTFYQWELQGLDLATAFLQTQPTEADQKLWTSGVAELKEAMKVPQDSVLRILRNIYGSTTAPRGLWQNLHRTLVGLGGVPAMGERCLWLWFSKEEKDPKLGTPLLLGAMGGHVDDFHRVGNQKSAEWLAICAKIDSSYQWGTMKSRSYRHAGTDINTIVQADGNFRIEVDQDAYVETVCDLAIEPSRLRCDGPLTGQEVAACRGALGALQWLAIQSQPQLCARCNILLTEIIVGGTLAHGREIQAMIGEVRRSPQKLRFFKLADVEHWSQLVFITMGDQAHNNRPKGDSTGGMVTLLGGPSCIHGAVSPMMLLSWRAWKLKRKAIASNDAEIQAVLEAEDSNFRARLLWSEINGAGHLRTSPRDDLVEDSEKQALCVKGVLCTDSRGGYDAVELNESPLLGLSNIRAALQAFQLRGNLQRGGCELRWLASDYDLGDSMTKKKQDSREGLMKMLSTWHWSIAYDPEFVAAKKNKKLGRTAVAKVDEALQDLMNTDEQILLEGMYSPCMAEKLFCAGATVSDLLRLFACEMSAMH